MEKNHIKRGKGDNTRSQQEQFASGGLAPSQSSAAPAVTVPPPPAQLKYPEQELEKVKKRAQKHKQEKVQEQMAAVNTAKKAFRKGMKDVLKGLDVGEVGKQSLIWTKTITSLLEYQRADRISVYLSMPSGELQTGGVVEDAFGRGKSIFIPYIHRLPKVIPLAPLPNSGKPPPASQMDMLSLSSLHEYTSLPRDSWGIPTIPSGSIAERENCLSVCGNEILPKGLDLVILPGVAFGVDGRRLGHGKGYYDVWLTRYLEAVGREKGMPVLVGTALKEQVCEAGVVPVDGTDWEVDVLVTGDGRVIRRGERGEEERR